ncbi:MAG: hypothetical protein KDA28_09610, partial [Phycisphaerales bacterium]|nr:hypothetical protein [Phycisphaerales bacterium]
MPRIRQHIRSAYHATVVTDGVPHDSVMVVLPDGTLLVDLPEQALDAHETIAWIPEDRRDACQVLATVHELEPHDPRQDRRLAYHGSRREAPGAILTIDAVKWGSDVLGG